MSQILAMWCSEGLECVIDITEEQKKAVWAELNSKKYKPGFELGHLIMRARANSQRAYEIYSFNSGDHDVVAVRRMFESDPQPIVDFVREHGTKIYSDRTEKRPVIV